MWSRLLAPCVRVMSLSNNYIMLTYELMKAVWSGFKLLPCVTSMSNHYIMSTYELMNAVWSGFKLLPCIDNLFVIYAKYAADGIWGQDLLIFFLAVKRFIDIVADIISIGKILLQNIIRFIENPLMLCQVALELHFLEDDLFQIWYRHLHNFTKPMSYWARMHRSCWHENSVDPDQLASTEASWSGSTLFSM